MEPIQMSVFDINCDNFILVGTNVDKRASSHEECKEETNRRLAEYGPSDYTKDVETIGLEKTWENICRYAAAYPDDLPPFLNAHGFCRLYEIGLALQDKTKKKKSGQYYTPEDVAEVMSEWLRQCEGTAICDVGCGTGNLILSYLDLIGREESQKLIASGNLYLYDADPVALHICKTLIGMRYGRDLADRVHVQVCDFLDMAVRLPENCKVIANPPYAQIRTVSNCWNKTAVLKDSGELYSAFMEKIFQQAASAVIITPFSFISGNKFYSLRKEMSERGYGFIVSFDNVPGNIFCGKKQGVFNSNTANSVRAAITVFHQSDRQKGFRISPLLRFKREERNRLLNTDLLESTLPRERQVVDETKQAFEKVDKTLTDLFRLWTEKSTVTVQTLLSDQPTEYQLDMPNTCRYFTTASRRKLSRTGVITLNLKDKQSFYFLYCFINSGFAYWWWRIYDGGITYPMKLLNEMPTPYNLLTEEDHAFFEKVAQKLMCEETRYIVTKVNAGVPQENIKFPPEYRKAINKKLLEILGSTTDETALERIHANQFFADNK